MATETTETKQLVDTFLNSCSAKGLSNNTIRVYSGALTQFALDNPQLPSDPSEIETWLLTKGESFTNRGNNLRRLQVFYEYLAQANILQLNPIQPGQSGRRQTTAKTTHTKPIIKPSPTSTPITPIPQTNTANLVTDYLTSCQARGLSERTLEGYRKQLGDFAALNPILTYDLADIEKFWAGYTAEHDEWKHQLFRTIRTFYYWLADTKELPTRLNFRRIAPKRSKKHPDNLSEEKAAQFLALLPTMSPQEQAIIELLIEAGPRAGELCSIVKENIYDDSLLVKGKTGERTIEISPHVRDALRNLIPEDSGPIFWGQTHKPLSTDAVYRIVSKHLAQIGITSGKRGPHMLRHSMGRLYMASATGDLESLRQQMGHTNITTTAIYSRLNRQQVHKKFDSANPRERIMQEIENGKSHQATLL